MKYFLIEHRSITIYYYKLLQDQQVLWTDIVVNVSTIQNYVLLIFFFETRILQPGFVRKPLTPDGA